MGMALLESTSVTTLQVWATCPSALSHQWKRWSSTLCDKVWSTPKTRRHSTAGWTMRKLNEIKRWCCATMTLLRHVLRSRLRASSPGCAPNLSRLSVSTCLSIAQTIGWYRKSVQITATKTQEPTSQQVNQKSSQDVQLFDGPFECIRDSKVYHFSSVSSSLTTMYIYVLVQYLACCRLQELYLVYSHIGQIKAANTTVYNVQQYLHVFLFTDMNNSLLKLQIFYQHIE